MNSKTVRFCHTVLRNTSGNTVGYVVFGADFSALKERNFDTRYLFYKLWV